MGGPAHCQALLAFLGRRRPGLLATRDGCKQAFARSDSSTWADILAKLVATVQAPSYK